MTILIKTKRSFIVGPLPLVLALAAIVMMIVGASASEGSRFFVTGDGRDLRALADTKTRGLLKRARGVGARFGSKQKARYCYLKGDSVPAQWVVNDLKTGRVIARSPNAEQLYFGASVAKLFVAAAFLDKKKGK